MDCLGGIDNERSAMLVLAEPNFARDRLPDAAQYPPPQRYCHAMPNAWKSCSRSALYPLML
jgi:hypothetical protein